MDINAILNPTSDAVVGPRRSGRKRKSLTDDAEPPLTQPQPSKKRKDSVSDSKVIQKKAPEKKTIAPKPTVDLTAEDDDLHGKQKSSANPIDLTGGEDEKTASTRKQGKRPKASGSEEKRLKKFRKQPPQKYETVMFRATTQRMVVVDRRRPNNDHCPHGNADCPMEEVDLAGSTGNVYTVRITHVYECTCPDFRINKNPQCKHILNVLVKILKAPEQLQYQAAYLTSELHEIFEHAGPLPTETVSAEDKDGKRKPIEGDCPICCEDLAETEAIVWCQAACGNNLHKSCFDQWAATKGHNHVTCPYCRMPWQSDSADPGALKETMKKGKKNRDGYVNLADQLGMSRTRDYSSYHSYWVASQRRQGLIDDDEGDYDEEYYEE